MSMSQIADEKVQVALLATSGLACLAADVIADRFGMTLPYTQNILDHGHGLLSPCFDRRAAIAMLPLLAALGLRVAIRPLDAMPVDESCDVSIWLRDLNKASKLRAALGLMPGMICPESAAFNSPQGHVIRDLPLARAEWLCNALRQTGGVFCAMSKHGTALYDLFAEARLSDINQAEVRRQLRLMGCSSGGFADAVGQGLQRRVLDRILVQLPGLGLFGIDRVFQRYELVVTGKGTLSEQEFADFMASRPVVTSVDPRKLMASLPLTLENWLTRPAARQFLGDYRLIGLQTVARLMRKSGKTSEYR